MAKELQQHVERIKSIMLDDDNINDAFEDATESLLAIDDDRKLSSAISILDDKFDLQDLMWSLLHKIEKFPEKYYVKSFIDALPGLSEKSPDWSATILGRCLNSESYRNIVKDQYAKSSAGQRRSIKTICDSLLKENPNQYRESIKDLLG